MEGKEVSEYLLDFQSRELPEPTPRNLEIGETSKVKTIIGPRRSGKTYFMYQRMKELMATGTRKENILYLNFEDPRLVGVTFKEIREILKLHWQLFPATTKGRLYVFIDEPQNISNWETAVRALHDDGMDVTLSGSSSKLLSREVATSLRGRTFTYLLLPFSFAEFLKTKGASFDVRRLSSREGAVLRSLLDEYLEYGGFPEVTLEKDRGNKEKTISEYLDMVVYRDLVERYKIRNAALIRWFIKTLATTFSRVLSVHKVYSTLKSTGIRASKNTLYSYLSMLEDSLFAFFVPKFSHSIRKREFSINKVYLCDIGFTRAAGASRNRGWRMENVVYLELKRRAAPFTEISCWKNPAQEEVDFVVSRGGVVAQLIQVCSDISDPGVRKREVRALLKASREVGCRNLLVITYDYEGEERKDGRVVRFEPVWRWLLGG